MGQNGAATGPEPGRTCWRIERAHRAALIVDAASYFRLAREAMLRARSQILIIGWDFDTRIDLTHEDGDDCPDELGAFLSFLPKTRPGVEIFILKWDLGAIKLVGRGTTLLRIARWALGDKIHFKLDGAHAKGASHHQKILVIDDQLAFCGGIDMTAERWDTREHRDDDPGRKRPTTRRAYGPWHDATMAVDGAAARALGELARERWRMAGGKSLPAPEETRCPWPEALQPDFREVDVAISRTRGAFGEGGAIREIEALFVEQIRRARRYVYAENQYFASRVITRAIVERLSEPDPPEFVVINPSTAQGWLDEEAMSPARAKLLEAVRAADHRDRFRIYTPLTAGGDHIYVHAKILIVDDQLIRVGSANFNNRSMRLDSECDLTIDTALEANSGIGERIGAVLHDLLAEHLGTTPERVEDELRARGSLIGAVEALRSDGRSLIPLPVKEPGKIESALAENEILDPEGSADEFEPLARPGLLKGLRSMWHRGDQRSG